MKKLMLMFTVAIVATTLQTANAQVSLNINIGTQPRYGYYTDYYARPVVHRSYYVSAPARYVYVDRNHYGHNRYYKPVRGSRTYYSTSTRYYNHKKNHYKHYSKSFKHNKGNGRGRH